MRFIIRSRALRAALPLTGVAALLFALSFGPGPTAGELPPAPPPPVFDRAALTGPEGLPAERLQFTTAADDGRVVVVRGSGWGHSVGMSQYGARAQAQAGRGHRDILAYYYPGTDVEEHPAADRDIRVGLFRNREIRDPDRLRLMTAGRGRAAPDQPVAVRLGDEEVALPHGEVWTLHVVDGDDRLALVDAEGDIRAEGAAPATVRFAHLDGEPTLLRLPQIARSGQSRSGTFQWGTLEVDVADGEVRPILVVPLERYLRGLAEMPPSWELEALKAQAIAGRTYAVRSMLDGVKDDCGCHLGATPHDQAYTGWEHEGGSAGDRWRAAVDGTRAAVATFEGELAWTYYSSSHGGRTEAAPDSWAYDETQAQPYLVSVDDPWSLEPASRNPRASWEVELPAAAVARAVGLTELDRIEILDRTGGGSPAVLRVGGTDLAGNPADYEFRGWRTGVAASDLKLVFRQELPSQQITTIDLEEPDAD